MGSADLGFGRVARRDHGSRHVRGAVSFPTISSIEKGGGSALAGDLARLLRVRL